GEGRFHAEVEAAVAVEEERRRPVPWEILPVDEEHRDSRAVLGRIEDLLDHVGLGVDGDDLAGPQPGAAAGDRGPPDLRRLGEGAEAVERLVLGGGPDEAARGADPRKRHGADRAPVERADLEPAGGVAEI